VTAVSPYAFSQTLRLVRRRGTVSLVGLPPGEFPTPIFDVVLKRITIRGSIVGTRRDLDEAIGFAVEGKVRPISGRHRWTTSMPSSRTVTKSTRSSSAGGFSSTRSMPRAAALSMMAGDGEEVMSKIGMFSPSARSLAVSSRPVISGMC
jgi:Zinc-binding dehydrogenase